MIPVQNNQQANQALISTIGGTVLLGAASTAVIGPSQNRRAVAFFNPGSVTIYICPSNQAAVIGQGVTILPGGAMAFNGDRDANLTFNCGWNGIAASGSNNPLTVLAVDTSIEAVPIPPPPPGGVILTSETGITLISEDGKILIAG